MSFRYGASTLYSSQLAGSRDTLRRSLLNMNTMLSENTVMRNSMELRQENHIFKDHITSPYDVQSRIISPSLPSAGGFSAGIGLSSTRRYPDPSSRGIYDPGHGHQSPIVSDDLGYTDQLSERSCCDTGRSCDCLLSPTALQRSERSCSCLVGPTLQRTERFAYRPTSTARTRTQRDENYRGSIVIPPPKIVGEIAFQLENRILDFIFSHHTRERADVKKIRRYSGHTVQNVAFLIQKEYTNFDGSINAFIKAKLKERLKYILVTLARFGYSLEEHASFADQMINEYGILTNAPDNVTMKLYDIDDADVLRGFITLLTKSQEDRKDMLILLECLLHLAKDSCKPLFLN